MFQGLSTASFRSSKPSSIKAAPCSDCSKRPLTQESETNLNITCRFFSCCLGVGLYSNVLLKGVSLTANDPKNAAVPIKNASNGSKFGSMINHKMDTSQDKIAIVRSVKRQEKKFRVLSLY